MDALSAYTSQGIAASVGKPKPSLQKTQTAGKW